MAVVVDTRPSLNLLLEEGQLRYLKGAENGTLQIMGLGEKLCYFFSYLVHCLFSTGYYYEIQKGRQLAISAIIKNVTVDTFAKDEREERVTTLFFKILGKANSGFAEAGKKNEELALIFNPQDTTASMREYLLKLIPDDENKPADLTAEDRAFYDKVKLAQLMIKLGNIKNGDGCGDTLFVKGWDGKNIAICKAKQGSSLVQYGSPKMFFTNAFVERLCLYDRVDEYALKEHIAETTASRLLEISNEGHEATTALKYPKVRVVSMQLPNGKKDLCSFGIWVQGSKTIADNYGLNKNTFKKEDPAKNKAVPKKPFSAWARSDYFLGNSDGHGKNVLTTEEETVWYEIDAGQALAGKHFHHSFWSRFTDYRFFDWELRNSCLFAEHELADNSFSTEDLQRTVSDIRRWGRMRDVIVENYSRSYILNGQDVSEESGENAAKRATCLLQRLAVLFILMSKNGKIKELKNYRSEDEIFGYISQNKDLLINAKDENGYIFSDSQLQNIFFGTSIKAFSRERLPTHEMLVEASQEYTLTAHPAEAAPSAATPAPSVEQSHAAITAPAPLASSQAPLAQPIVSPIASAVAVKPNVANVASSSALSSSTPHAAISREVPRAEASAPQNPPTSPVRRKKVKVKKHEPKRETNSSTPAAPAYFTPEMVASYLAAYMVQYFIWYLVSQISQEQAVSST